ncbi:hypothetical protein SAMN05216480_101375 [Pustulibacterium marinum]|uniref:Uncharacterized protein n=1 Tax=Pustulibacterium marinum TaxID=1224947 RepID=A0A1I7EX73_9FLAO|nr:hypothetical protein [Pustulibacterium marinum]SFU28526.1 hypothetical protein SAMN05216480_101375 [Pustulibacterium marinum]
MKNLKFRNLVFLSLLATLFVGCGDDDELTFSDDDGTSTEVEITVSGELTENTTWTADHIYIMDGKVIVADGITLTIEPGTIIKGEDGLEADASALVVDQGGKLMAEGTSSNPIIFTSVDDNIAVGEQWGTNLTTANNGLWGGVIILGKAPISASGDSETAQIEGIAATESYGQYGGTEPGDNSGILNYISIRHGGVTIGEDNEINGLTLGGVGSGTTISNIEIVANQDDGIEWFGGTVNVSNAIVYSQGDDGFDTDQGWSGTLSNGVVIMGENSGTGLELDGPEGTTDYSGMMHTMENLTLIGYAGNTSSRIADFRDGNMVALSNVLVYDFGRGVRFNGNDAVSEFENGNITFANVEVVLPDGYETAADLLSAYNDDEASVELSTEAVDYFGANVTAIDAASNATVGASTSVFGWTYASAQGAF